MNGHQRIENKTNIVFQHFQPLRSRPHECQAQKLLQNSEVYLSSIKKTCLSLQFFRIGEEQYKQLKFRYGRFHHQG